MKSVRRVLALAVTAALIFCGCAEKDVFSKDFSLIRERSEFAAENEKYAKTGKSGGLVDATRTSYSALASEADAIVVVQITEYLEERIDDFTEWAAADRGRTYFSATVVASYKGEALPGDEIVVTQRGCSEYTARTVPLLECGGCYLLTLNKLFASDDYSAFAVDEYYISGYDTAYGIAGEYSAIGLISTFDGFDCGGGMVELEEGEIENFQAAKGAIDPSADEFYVTSQGDPYYYRKACEESGVSPAGFVGYGDMVEAITLSSIEQCISEILYAGE